MKKGNFFGASAILTLVLSLPVFAGDIQTPTITPPPPPPASATTAPGTTSDGSSVSEATSDFFIELLLGAIKL